MVYKQLGCRFDLMLFLVLKRDPSRLRLVCLFACLFACLLVLVPWRPVFEKGVSMIPLRSCLKDWSLFFSF